MSTFLATLSPMLTLFLCMAIGFGAGKANLLPETAGKTLAKCEAWIFYPALCFMTMLRFCTLDTLTTHATNILIATVSIACAILISFVLIGFFTKKGDPERGVYRYALTFANSGYLGDPIVLALFGESILSYYKLFSLPLSIACYTWGVGLLMPHSGKRTDALRRIFNPPTVATLLGLALGLLGVGPHLPGFLLSTLDSLKACMGPVGMLLAGLTIAKYKFLPMLKNVKVYAATFLRLLLIPAIIISILYGVKTLGNLTLGLSVGNDVLFLALFTVATPLGLNTVIFPEAYNGNPQTGAGMTLISHTLCVITIPLVYALMTAIFGVPFQA